MWRSFSHFSNNKQSIFINMILLKYNIIRILEAYYTIISKRDKYHGAPNTVRYLSKDNIIPHTANALFKPENKKILQSAKHFWNRDGDGALCFIVSVDDALTKPVVTFVQLDGKHY